MGQDCELLSEVTGWINAKATKPVWAKMTPNITDITQPARVAAQQGEGGRGELGVRLLQQPMAGRERDCFWSSQRWDCEIPSWFVRGTPGNILQHWVCGVCLNLDLTCCCRQL